MAYRANGQVKEAVSLLVGVVKIQEQTLAEDHPDRLKSQHRLAIAYQANGQVKEAVSLLEHVVKIRKQRLAEDHPSRLASQHVLAMAYQANGQEGWCVSIVDAEFLLEYCDTLLQVPSSGTDVPSTSHIETGRMYRSSAIMYTCLQASLLIKLLTYEKPKRNAKEGNISHGGKTTGFNDDMMKYQLPPPQDLGRTRINESDFLCAPTQRTSNQTINFPRLSVLPGSYVAMKYLENGHVTLPQVSPGKPIGGGTVFVFGTLQPRNDELLMGVLQWTTDGTGGDGRERLLAAQNFDDGRCYQINAGNISVAQQKAFPDAV